MALSFSKFKNLFVVSEPEEETKEVVENKEVKTQQTTQVTPPQQQVVNPTRPVNTNLGTNVMGEFDQKIFDSLMKALNDSNLPGEDYLEFIDAYNAMKSLPIDDKMKMQTVLATLSTKGLTKDAVVKSADHYLNILNQEMQKFGMAMQNKMDADVKGKSTDIVSLESQMKLKAEQIQILTQEINEIQQMILKSKDEIAQTENKIKSVAMNYDTTFNLVTKQIKDNIEKIKSL